MTTGAGLAACPIGVVPILWNNVDVADLRAPIDAATVLDEIAAVGFDGCQFGAGFPEGAALTAELERRGLRLAEVYASVPTVAGAIAPSAIDGVRERIDLLRSANGEVLVVAFDIDADRNRFVSRTTEAGCPALDAAGWNDLAALLAEIAATVGQSGHRAAFHPHAGTFIENPAETEQLVGVLRDVGIGLCLDIAHYAVGGGDPVAAIDEYRDVLSHVHLKNVDASVLDRLRSGDIATLHDALRERLFTDLGQGILDLDVVLGRLAAIGYDGWLMLEQDTSWNPPAEAATAGKSALDAALQRLASD